MPQNRVVVEQQSAKKDTPRAVGASAPADSGRVVIESVWPEIDGGRTAVKRVIHDWLEVAADIFSDGHAIIMAELLYRASDENGWCRVPMRKGDNDRWSARFELGRLFPISTRLKPGTTLMPPGRTKHGKRLRQEGTSRLKRSKACSSSTPSAGLVTTSAS
jgi:Domain of unknown function (DUF3416)